MSQVIYKIVNVCKLLEELQEGFITNDPVPSLTYEKQEVMSRNLYGDYRRNIYCLESHGYYKVKLEKQVVEDTENCFIFNNLLDSGIFYTLTNDCYLYLYNFSENNTYIDSKIKLKEEK